MFFTESVKNRFFKKKFQPLGKSEQKSVLGGEFTFFGKKGTIANVKREIWRLKSGEKHDQRNYI